MGSTGDDRKEDTGVVRDNKDVVGNSVVFHVDRVDTMKPGLVEPAKGAVVMDDVPFDACRNGGRAILTGRGARSNGAPKSEIDQLRAENKLLRLALQETQEKLRFLSTEHDREDLGRRREPGNGGVAYAQMRRLLLKDETFLRRNFLSFLNIEDLGRCSAVCRVFKKGTYNCDVVARCMESGGVTDATRGLLWLIMVDMEPPGACSKGVLSVVAEQKPESPEEQYDRLHRAMNGTAVELTARAEDSRTSTAYGGGSLGDQRGVGVDEKPPLAGRPAPIDTSHGTIASSAGGLETLAKGFELGESNGPSHGGGDSGARVSFNVEDGGVLVGEPTNGHRRSSSQMINYMDDALVEVVDLDATSRPSMAEPDTESSVQAPSMVMPGNGTMIDASASAFGIHRTRGSKNSLSVSSIDELSTSGDGNAAPASTPLAPFDVFEEGDDLAPPPVTLTSTAPSVVGWASGLFRRTTSGNSPKTMPAPHSVGFGPSPSPAPERGTPPIEASQHSRRDSGSSVSGLSPVSSSRITRGLLYGLRYARYTKPKSELPSDSSYPMTMSKRFFGDSSGKGRDDAGMGAGTKAPNGGREKADGADDGWPAVERVPGLYSALLNGADAMDANDITGVRGPKQSCFVDIEKDVKRTLGMSDVSALRNVLRCTSTFVPDVGYVQGMNFVCRCLLQVFDEEEAFWVFVGMLQRFGLRRLYCPGMPLLRLRFFQLNRLLMWHLPSLHGHFEACGVTADLFATSWFVTLLSDGGMLPDEEVKVLWDRLFLHASSPASQWASIFLVLLELLRRAEDMLKMESRFSELIHRLVNMPFRDLCKGRGACTMMEEAGKRFETSSPMAVQLLLLHDQWLEGVDDDPNAGELGEERQLM